MRVTLNYCTIADVQQVAPKKGDNQKKDRIVLLNIDEEDITEGGENQGGGQGGGTTGGELEG